MTISLAVQNPNPLTPLVVYRASVTAADSTTVNPVAFTTTQQLAAPTVTGAIPVLQATGTANAFVSARLTNSADTIGLTLVGLQITQGAGATPTVTVLGAFSPEVTLAATSASLIASAGVFYTQSGIASTYGSRGSTALGAGVVTHVAWVVTTAPAHSADVYAWLSG